MASMTECLIRNLMIILANATIRKNIAARIGSTVSAVRIACQGLPAHRVRWGQEGLPVLKGFPVSEDRLVPGDQKESPAPSARKDL